MASSMYRATPGMCSTSARKRMSFCGPSMSTAQRRGPAGPCARRRSLDPDIGRFRPHLSVPRARLADGGSTPRSAWPLVALPRVVVDLERFLGGAFGLGHVLEVPADPRP